jgi:hypothetical protein
MAKLDVVHGWDQIREYLPVNYAVLADKYEQIETKFGNAKIRDADTLLRFILLHVGANLPLRQTVALTAEAGLPNLSPMRLHKKMCRAAPYLQALVSGMLDWSAVGSPEKWGGYVFSAVDATVVCGPGATGTDARIHTKLRVADVSLASVEVTDERGGETFCRFQWEAGELAVGDRAYCGTRGVLHVVNSGADVLVRYRLGGLPLLDEADNDVDVLAKARTLPLGSVLDLDVHVPGLERDIDGRLIIMRLPPDAAERARHRVRKDNGSSTSEQMLEAAGYVILFTTATRTRLDAERCLQGYRLRWQIELQFKRWKSLCNFDGLPNQRDDTILSWLYGKVLLGALLDRMASIPTELSPPDEHGVERSNRECNDATDVVRPVETHEHPVPARHRRSAATRAA